MTNGIPPQHNDLMRANREKGIAFASGLMVFLVMSFALAFSAFGDWVKAIGFRGAKMVMIICMVPAGFAAYGAAAGVTWMRRTKQKK